MTSPISRRNLFRSAATASLASAVRPASAQSKHVKIGIVGGNFGSGFQWHLAPDCEVAAVCDINPPRLDRLAQVYHCSSTYKGLREMLKHEGLNAIGVFAPAPLHAW